MKSKSSFLLASVIALAVAGWMFSDDLIAKYGDQSSVEIDPPAVKETDDEMSVVPKFGPSVSAVQVKNKPIVRIIRASGVSEAKFEMTVSATSGGQIVALKAVEGNKLKTGDVLVRLDRGTLPEQINAAKANLKVAKKRLEITERLAKENFSAPLEQVERAAAVAEALSQLRQLEKKLLDTVIVAPVSGYLERLHIEKGERVSRDTPIATILGLNKLSVVVAVPQNEVARIKIGSKAKVSISGSGSRNGIVSKIATKSNPATRTFDIEIDLPNKDRKLRVGMSVEASIDAGEVLAFAMSPAHLSVSEDGNLTAKIAFDGKAVEVPVEMVRSGAERVFVSGLPNDSILLTVGQGFVEDGAKVTYKLLSES